MWSGIQVPGHSCTEPPAGNRRGGEGGSGPPGLLLAHLEEEDEERRDFGVQKTHPRNLKNTDSRLHSVLMGERASRGGPRTSEPPAGVGQLGGGEKAGKEVRAVPGPCGAGKGRGEGLGFRSP